MLSDTIAAISTPLGEGGIGIVRISGEQALEVVSRVFKPKYKKDLNRAAGFTMHLGYIYDKNNKVIDEVLVSIMRGPKSFTGENVVEINCHGGLIPLKLTLEAVLQAGARLAEPGEFSKRAFINGRIDLPQAEAIIDIIRAKNETGLSSALNQLGGKLSEEIRKIRHDLLGLLAAIEAAIDFPEEDLDDITHQEVIEKVKTISQILEKLINSFDQGKFIREGINTAIIGRTNVGKSSLLNALLGENRSIVTDIPGTTRDTIEEYVNMGGFYLKIIDTAGIRDTSDLVEKMGVERTKEIIRKADLVLFVLDISVGMTEEDQEILSYLKGKRTIVLVNKIDLNAHPKRKAEIEKWIHGFPLAYISAKNEIGIDELEELIVSTIMKGKVLPKGDLFITNIRHKESLTKAFHNLTEVLQGAKEKMTLDFLSIDLRGAWEALGEITGDTADEDLLDRIFADFCIGK
ncbi:MAG: tRNA uridine-5-carboxymethylaminomethyl(34) synthesis GTPase MnmE [Bacillota bacterium]|jgi:tRNA modification GTPase